MHCISELQINVAILGKLYEVYMTHLNQVNVGAKNEYSRSLNQIHK